MPTISALGIGSGLDLNGLLDQLDSAEREKLAPVIRTKNSVEAKISAYGQLRSALEQFHTTSEKLNKSSVFESVKSTVSGESLIAAASSGAASGTWQVNVSNLASAWSVATTGIADQDENLGAGTVALDLADGSSISVTLAANASSLTDLRDAINAEEGGVRASIVNDGSDTPYRLSLTAVETGTDAAVTAVDFGALATSLATDAGTEVLAADANLVVNGVPVSSQSNQVKGAIEGLTFSLISEGESSVQVTTDTDAIEKTVTDFVSAYNKLQEQVSTLTSYNADTGDAGKLLGDSSMRSIESRMRNVFSANGGEGGVTRLSDLGITLQLDGTLKTDETVLSDAIALNREDVAAFFAADSNEDGLAGRLDIMLNSVLESGGLLENATDGLEGRLERLEERYQRTEQGITKTLEYYRKQFASLDSMVAQMNSTSNYVTQQFSIMNAQLGSN